MPHPPSGASERLVHFDHFRAVAILLIILGHSYHAWKRDSFTELVASNIITGGTALFVFISGFFYCQVFHGRMRTGAFFAKKAEQVLLPYVILSLVGFAAFLTVRGALPSPVDFGLAAVPETLARAGFNLITGHTITAYWYVPFIMLIFALSPGFDRFIRAPGAARVAITAAGFVIAAFVHRPEDNLNPLHSVLYFAPFYLLGILYSLHRPAWDVWLERMTVPVALAAFSSAALMVAQGQVGNLHKALPWAAAGPDLMVLQKICLILFLLALLLRFRHLQSRFLARVADASFALFFLHPWMIELIKRAVFADVDHGFAEVYLLFALSATLSYVAADLARVLLGRHSRHIIGW